MGAPDKIDVLAVLKELAFKTEPFGDESVAIEKYRQARAAVADLVEAAAEMHRLAKGPAGGVSQADKKAIVDRMDAALVKFGEQP